MEKISAAQAAQVYAEIPGVLRSICQERDELREKLAEATAKIQKFEEAARIEKIARAMHEKGIDRDATYEDKIERIKEAASGGKSLEVIEQAVDMTAPNGSIGKLASDDRFGNGEDGLTSFLLGSLSS